MNSVQKYIERLLTLGDHSLDEVYDMVHNKFGHRFGADQIDEVYDQVIDNWVDEA